MNTPKSNSNSPSQPSTGDRFDPVAPDGGNASQPQRPSTEDSGSTRGASGRSSRGADGLKDRSADDAEQPGLGGLAPAV